MKQNGNCCRKYIIVSLIPEPFAYRLKRFMDEIASITRIDPPHQKFPPHVTLHPPLIVVNESDLHDLIRNTVLQVSGAKITVNGLTAFGRNYIVLPVHQTQNVAQLWVGLTKRLSLLDGYTPAVRMKGRVLHVTVAKKTYRVFPQVWPKIRRLQVEPMTISLKEVALYRKINGDPWSRIETFQIPT